MAKDKLMDFDQALELFEPVLGFEVHVELNTKTKMFSAAPDSFGREPNSDLAAVERHLLELRAANIELRNAA